MTLEDARTLIHNHTDYGGSVDVDGLAEAIVKIGSNPSAQQELLGFIDPSDVRRVRAGERGCTLVTVWRSDTAELSGRVQVYLAADAS